VQKAQLPAIIAVRQSKGECDALVHLAAKGGTRGTSFSIPYDARQSPAVERTFGKRVSAAQAKTEHGLTRFRHAEPQAGPMTDPSAFAPSDILAFWFSDAVKGKWFGSGESFDAELRHRFGGLLQSAKLGALAHWAENPDGVLALVILLDQFSRNIHRGAPEAFAADPLALETAKQAIAQGYDLRLTPEGRGFLYLPFEHSEALADQDRGVALFEALGLEEALDYMRRHREIIARFGRFPHRNAILGRVSTPEEIEFLKRPGSSF
jgi:uncharacterized protein (DUF924 family)